MMLKNPIFVFMKPINECLNPKLAEICQKAMQLEQMQDKLIPLLPENLKDHCRVGSFEQGNLHLVVTDAVWASQLRYLIPELRDNLRKSGLYQLLSIKIVILAEEKTNLTKRSVKATPISEQTKILLKKEGEKIAYEPLKQALLKLAE